MTISITLVVLACFTLVFLFKVARSRSIAARALENPGEHIRPVDLEAFRNLIDPDEELYLRARLPPSDFRTIQRERMRAAIEYINGAAQNAAILLRLAEGARHSADPATAQAAERLIDNAIRTRLYAFRAIPKLYIAMVLPGGRAGTIRVAESYEQMTRQVVLLGLQQPKNGITTALFS